MMKIREMTTKERLARGGTILVIALGAGLAPRDDGKDNSKQGKPPAQIVCAPGASYDHTILDDAQPLIDELSVQFDLVPDGDHPWHSMPSWELWQQPFWLQSDGDGGINGRTPYVAEVLFINGVTNDPPAHRAGIQFVEQALKAPVTGIYNLSEGMQDFEQSFREWMAQIPGMRLGENPATIALIQQIKWQFEHKPADFNLTIVAHSQGALITRTR